MDHRMVSNLVRVEIWRENNDFYFDQFFWLGIPTFFWSWKFFDDFWCPTEDNFWKFFDNSTTLMIDIEI